MIPIRIYRKHDRMHILIWICKLKTIAVYITENRYCKCKPKLKMKNFNNQQLLKLPVIIILWILWILYVILIYALIYFTNI